MAVRLDAEKSAHLGHEQVGFILIGHDCQPTAFKTHQLSYRVDAHDFHELVCQRFIEMKLAPFQHFAHGIGGCHGTVIAAVRGHGIINIDNR